MTSCGWCLRIPIRDYNSHMNGEYNPLSTSKARRSLLTTQVFLVDKKMISGNYLRTSCVLHPNQTQIVCPDTLKLPSSFNFAKMLPQKMPKNDTAPTKENESPQPVDRFPKTPCGETKLGVNPTNQPGQPNQPTTRNSEFSSFFFTGFRWFQRSVFLKKIPFDALKKATKRRFGVEKRKMGRGNGRAYWERVFF